MAQDLIDYGDSTEAIDYGDSTEDQPNQAPLSLTEKARNLFMTGSPSKGTGHYNIEDQPKFEFPRWLEVAGSTIALGEGALALYKDGPALLAAAKAFKQGATPKLATKLGNLYESVTTAMKAARDPDYAKLVKSGENFAAGKGTGTKFTPGGDAPIAGPATSAYKPKGPPEAPPEPPRKGTRTPFTPGAAESYSPAKPAYKPKGPPDTLQDPEAPRRGTGTKFSPKGDAPSSYDPAKSSGSRGPKAAFTPPSKPNLKTSAIKEQLGEEIELPNSGTPKRAPRADPIAQKRSEEIAALNRHADVVPLAQQTVQQGVTGRQLLALNPAQKATYMAKIGLKGRSDATWRTYIGHVLRLEKLAK